jgi:hypothetical protein
MVSRASAVVSCEGSAVDGGHSGYGGGFQTVGARSGVSYRRLLRDMGGRGVGILLGLIDR